MSQEEQSKPWEIVPAGDREVARRSMDLVSRGLEDLQSSRPVPTPQCQPAELDLSGPWRCRATLNHDQPWDRSPIRQRFRSFGGQHSGFLFPARR